MFNMVTLLPIPNGGSIRLYFVNGFTDFGSSCKIVG
jgi:hypothetical protein